MLCSRLFIPLALAAMTAGAAAAGPLEPADAPTADPTVLNPTAASLDLALPLDDAQPLVDPTFAAIVYRPRHVRVVAAGSYPPPHPRYDAIQYHEITPRPLPNPNPIRTPTTFFGGGYDPDGSNQTSFLLGLRSGALVAPHLQIGASADWIYHTSDQTVVSGAPYEQGGVIVTPTRVLSRASSNLYPMLAFIQLYLGESLPIVPYAGVGGGYEILWVTADDLTTGSHFDGTFGNWGWQAWAGAGLRLSKEVRLTGEAFLNECTPKRDINGPNGTTTRETVSVNGVGLRAGIQWGF